MLLHGAYSSASIRTSQRRSIGVQANSMAFGRKLSVNPNVCALCNKTLEDMSHVGGDAPAEETIQLPCKHLYHALCIRGWTMVGKKDTCPTCLEKTDLHALYADRPWEARNLQYNGTLRPLLCAL
jgi:RING finger protein 121/175